MACEPGNNLVMQVPLQGSSSGRGPGLQREIAQDHVSGKRLSRDRKPGRLTLEQNHTQYFHPLDLESDNPQVKRKQIHAGYAQPPTPTQRRHGPFVASVRRQDVISTMSRRPGYHLHVPTANPRKPPSFPIFPLLDSTNPTVYISHTNGMGS